MMGKMSIAPLPSALQHLGGRRFAFYPAIRNIGPNEWLYRRATWSECVVMNTQTGEEICVPRMFIGDVTGTDEPLMLVSLSRELAWKDGAIIPRERHVIEFPRPLTDLASAPDEIPAPAQRRSATVVNIRLEPRHDVKVWRWVGVAAILGVVGFGIVADATSRAQSRQRPDLFRSYRGYLQLTASDDYGSTVRKLGRPTTDRGIVDGGRVYRALTYTQRRYAVVLMGTAPGTGRYIGAVDARGLVLDAVRLPDGASSERLLQSLAAF
jgi:hypothetical protein